MYTSNVEQYLFQQGDDWRHFHANVETLPLHSASAFIRSVANRGFGGYGGGPAGQATNLMTRQTSRRQCDVLDSLAPSDDTLTTAETPTPSHWCCCFTRECADGTVRCPLDRECIMS